MIKIYRTPTDSANKEDQQKLTGGRKKKHEDKQNLFPANESVNINLKDDGQNSILNPNDVNLSKIL